MYLALIAVSLVVYRSSVAAGQAIANSDPDPEVEYQSGGSYTYVRAPFGKEVHFDIERQFPKKAGLVFEWRKFEEPYAILLNKVYWKFQPPRTGFNYLGDPVNNKWSFIINAVTFDDTGVYFLNGVDKSTGNKFGETESYFLEVYKNCEDEGAINEENTQESKWTYYENHCYWASAKPDWIGALGDCALKDADLAFPWNNGLNNFLLELAKGKHEDKLWLGGSDVSHYGNWTWEYGGRTNFVHVTPSRNWWDPYSNWAPGHPKGDHYRNCMSMGPDGKWLTRECRADKNLNYICVKNDLYDWIYFKGSYYKHITTTQPHRFTMDLVCRDHGAHLATPKSRDELTWLAYLTGLKEHILTNAVFYADEGKWFWEHSSEEVTWFDWVESRYPVIPEHYRSMGLVRVNDNNRYSYKMFNLELGNIKPPLSFVCQKRQPKCKEGFRVGPGIWHLTSDACFYFERLSRSWSGSQWACWYKGGELATAKSLRRNALLVSLIRSHSPYSAEYVRPTWLSGRRTSKYGPFRWRNDNDQHSMQWTYWAHVPSGWTCLNQKCMRYFSGTKYLNIQEARDKCAEEGGSLPRPMNEQENKLLMKFSNDLGLTGSHWLDMQLNEQNKWIWQDGSMIEVSWTNWKQTSDGQGNCVQFQIGTVNSIGKWLRVPCSHTKWDTLCEKPQGPPETDRSHGCIKMDVDVEGLKNGSWLDRECNFDGASAVCEHPLVCTDQKRLNCARISEMISDWFCETPSNKVSCCKTYGRVCYRDGIHVEKASSFRVMKMSPFLVVFLFVFTSIA